MSKKSKNDMIKKLTQTSIELIDEGKIDGAKTILKKLIKLDQGNPHHLYNLGMIFFKNHEFYYANELF